MITETNMFAIAGAARIVDGHPSSLRWAFFPSGVQVLQGGYRWQKGNEHGMEWRALPVVLVDAQGREIPS